MKGKIFRSFEELHRYYFPEETRQEETPEELGKRIAREALGKIEEAVSGS